MAHRFSTFRPAEKSEKIIKTPTTLTQIIQAADKLRLQLQERESFLREEANLPKPVALWTAEDGIFKEKLLAARNAIEDELKVLLKALFSLNEHVTSQLEKIEKAQDKEIKSSSIAPTASTPLLKAGMSTELVNIIAFNKIKREEVEALRTYLNAVASCYKTHRYDEMHKAECGFLNSLHVLAQSDHPEMKKLIAPIVETYCRVLQSAQTRVRSHLRDFLEAKIEGGESKEDLSLRSPSTVTPTQFYTKTSKELLAQLQALEAFVSRPSGDRALSLESKCDIRSKPK